MSIEQQIRLLSEQVLALRIVDWYDKVISFQWVLLVIMLILPWIIWWKLVDRGRIAQILSFGLMILVVDSFISQLGLNLIWWRYPYSLFPYSQRAFAMSYSLLPVTYMLIYQYYRTWKSFSWANLAAAFSVAFIVQPILKWLNMYQLIKSNYFYSFLIIALVGFALRYLHQVILDQPVPEGDKTRVEADGDEHHLVSPAFKRFFGGGNKT